MTAPLKPKTHHNTIREEYLRGQHTNPDPLGIRTTFHPTNTLRQLLVHPKEQVPKLDRLSLMYHIPCKNCPPTYIGQTSRTLSQRIKEHQRSVRNCDLATSALAEHSHSTGHPISREDVNIINSCLTPPEDVCLSPGPSTVKSTP